VVDKDVVGTKAEEWKLIIKSTTTIHVGDQLYNNYGPKDVGRLLRDYGFLPTLGASGQTYRLWKFTGRRYAFLEHPDGSVTTPKTPNKRGGEDAIEVYEGEDGLSFSPPLTFNSFILEPLTLSHFTLEP
jgi:hypothetical protein